MKTAFFGVLDAHVGRRVKPTHTSVVIYVNKQFVGDLPGDETKARVCMFKRRDEPIGAIKARFSLSPLGVEGRDVCLT